MTYDDIAARFGVKRCEACDHTPNKYNHQTGAWSVAVRTDPMTGVRTTTVTIHWADRKATRAGLRHYLILIHDAQTILTARRERWHRVWANNIWAASVARKELRITIPVRYSAGDRAYVWAHIQSATDVPAAARAWAKPKEITHGN